MSIFTNMQKAMYNVVTSLMGDDAVVLPSDGSSTMRGKVLLKDPTQDIELQGENFSDIHPVAEYQEGNFVGLKELVDSVKNKEKMTIVRDGVREVYNIRKIKKKYDGKTYLAILDK